MDERQNLLDFYKEVIAEHLIPSQILPHLANFISKSDMDRILLMENNKGSKEASYVLISSLQNCIYEGWYQGFIDSLTRTDYTLLVEILNGHVDISKQKMYKNLLNIFYPILIHDLDAEDILPYLVQCECLNDDDQEDIQKASRTKGRRIGCLNLLKQVVTKNVNWLACLMHALKNCNYSHLVAAIEPEFIGTDSLAGAEEILEKIPEANKAPDQVQNLYVPSPTASAVNFFNSDMGGITIHKTKENLSDEENECNDSYDEIDASCLPTNVSFLPSEASIQCTQQSREVCGSTYYNTFMKKQGSCPDFHSYYNFSHLPDIKNKPKPSPDPNEDPPPLLPRKTKLIHSISLPQTDCTWDNPRQRVPMDQPGCDNCGQTYTNPKTLNQRKEVPISSSTPCLHFPETYKKTPIRPPSIPKITEERDPRVCEIEITKKLYWDCSIPTPESEAKDIWCPNCGGKYYCVKHEGRNVNAVQTCCKCDIPMSSSHANTVACNIPTCDHPVAPPRRKKKQKRRQREEGRFTSNLSVQSQEESFGLDFEIPVPRPTAAESAIIDYYHI